MGDEQERIPQIRRRLINFTTERWDSLAHHREDAEEFHGHAAGDILWLLDEVDRLRAVEAAATILLDDCYIQGTGPKGGPCEAEVALRAALAGA